MAGHAGDRPYRGPVGVVQVGEESLYQRNSRGFDLLCSGTSYLQPLYTVNESFPFKWIKKWREGFYY